MKTLFFLSAFFGCFLTNVSAKTSAIIEVWKRSMVLPAAHNLTVIEYKRIKVLSESGYEYALFQDYYNSFKKIKNISYTIIDSKNRNIKKFSKADALDVLINPSYEIDDARILFLDPEYRDFPFTVEITVETVYKGFINFPSWMPRFAPDLEIKSAEMTLECYKDFKFRSREINGFKAPLVTQTGTRRRIRWSITNLPAVEKHISYKSFAANQAQVLLTPLSFTLGKTSGTFVSWTDFGEWYRILNEGRNKISDQTKIFLDSLRERHGTDEKSLTKAVYQFMQGKTRYISIQLGIGGYQTIPSDEVEKTGYGDCKGLTNYMKAMLDYLHISSNNVLVKAGDDVPDVLHDFPSNQFNHVILAVPSSKDTLWFECTSQTAPPAFTGTFTDDRYALWVDKNKSTIIRTPVLSAHESVRTSSCIVKLDAFGNAEIDLKIQQKGMFYEDLMYYQNLSKDRIARFNISKFDYKDFSLQQFNFSTPEENRPILDLFYSLSVNGLGTNLGTKMMVPLTILPSLSKSIETDMVNRKAGIRRSFTIEEDVDIVVPENYRIDSIPEMIEEVSEFGSFEMSFKVTGENVLHVYKRAVILKGNYENEQFDRFYDTIKNIKQIEQKKIVIHGKT